MNDTGHIERKIETIDTLKVIVENPPSSDQTCSIVPRGVMANNAFLVDTSKLGHVSDVLADDCGVWLNNGNHKKYYQKIDSEFTIINNMENLPSNYYV